STSQQLSLPFFELDEWELDLTQYGVLVNKKTGEVKQKFNFWRIYNSRGFKKQVLKLFCTVFAPLEAELSLTKLYPTKDKRWILDFSLDQTISPVVFGSNPKAFDVNGYQSALYNTWLESDWAMSYAITKLVELDGYQTALV